MYRLSTQSTSTTNLVAAPRGELAFSPIAVTSGIYSTLIEKSYPQRPNVCSSALENLGERILERVQGEVTAVLLETGLDPRIDWGSRVFGPIIATFDIVEELGVCQGDMEYIFLLVTALSLAFELLLLAVDNTAGRARTFLALAFRDIFVEPEICRTVDDMLQAEQARLTFLNAEMKVITAIRHLRILLPDIEACTAAWDASMLDKLQGKERDYYLRKRLCIHAPLEPAGRISMCSEEACVKFVKDSDIFTPLRLRAAAPFDVFVNVFLKYGCSWLVDRIISTNSDGRRTTMNTSDGLSIELEAGCSVSPITGVHGRWSVSKSEGSASGVTGTISIPPGCSYRIVRVEEVRERRSEEDWMSIETANAFFEIGEGDYTIRRVNVGSRVIVENVIRPTR